MPNRADIQAKVPGQLNAPFEQAIPEAVIQKILKDKGELIARHFITGLPYGHGCHYVLTRQKFKQCRQPNYCLVSYRRRDCSPADTGAYSKVANAYPLTVLQPLLKQNS